MKRSHAMPFGAQLTEGGGALFRLWAPSARSAALVRSAGPDGGARAMTRCDGGWFELQVERASTQTRYAFQIDGGPSVPDPASRSNPDGVHRPSALTDPLAFDWPDGAWRGRPWSEAVIYELHLGCFTREGGFAAATARLDDLVALGVTAIELMPVASFPGRRGWGYDGVLLFAPQPGYGTPEDFKRLVAAAHQRGLMVLLDVVYNHFGPDGNYLHTYARPFLNAAVTTPWGAAINFDGAQSRTVRDYFIHNALYWIEEFHLDGLRIDAVHAMHDGSPLHFVDELAQAVRAGPGRERPVHLVLENDANDAARLARPPDGTARLADAQCNDDVHHALHVLLTGETDGYYRDFEAEPLRLFGRALAQGFAYQGEPSPCSDGRARGTRSVALPPLAFVNYLQNHDQIGNRALGERIAMLAMTDGRDDALRALTACVLLAPSPPLLFMGEEFAASSPFLYFCDHEGELGQAVARGRRAEFGRFERFADPAARERIPDPNAESSFTASQLDWRERDRAPHSQWLSLYTELLRRRRQALMPWLDGARSGHVESPVAGLLRITWPLAAGRRWHLLAYLADDAAPAGLSATLPGESVYASHAEAGHLAPWSVRVALESP